MVIVPTGTANTASVIAAFQRLDVEPVLAADSQMVDEADRVVLPGVGAFGPAIDRIDQLGMREAMTSRIENDQPTLAICLGMQLLCGASDESPDSVGLGVVQQSVTRFTGDVKVPQLGWNRVEPDGSNWLEQGWAYFANSYMVPRLPEGWSGATTEYGGSFVSAMERGSVLACQFHPELSGVWGSNLLRRWVWRDS
ncbi:MAG TPA: imidazole glycerol phosphate synthase subunit HisH [Acidimicrobiia bacterium]